MKTKTIKAVLIYLGHRTSDTAQDYRLEKIVGAPAVEIRTGDQPTDHRTARIGDILTEEQAEELANRIEITTIPDATKY